MKPQNKTIYLLLFAAGILFYSCGPAYHIAKANRTEYHIDSTLTDDPVIVSEYKPYKTQLDAKMNAVIGHNARELTKSYDDPETLLGDFFSDALLTESKKIVPDIDFAMPSTKGGLRNNIPPGDIHLYNVFELMPFENETVVLTLKGANARLLLDAIAKAGGEPVAGLKMQIANGKATNVLINGKPFDETKNYRVLTSDYVAGGGDHIAGLQNPV